MGMTSFNGVVHIDTDCGVDDALALAVLGQVAKVASVSTTWGNCSALQAAANARYILQRTKAAQIEVTPAYDDPPTSWAPSHVHGPDGMGGVFHLSPAERSRNGDTAVSAIVRFAERAGKGGRLLAIAPLTNVAAAYRAAPEALHSLDRIVVMASQGLTPRSAWLDETGDTNTRHNPSATAEIAASPLPVTWVGIDVTRHVLLSADAFGESEFGKTLRVLSKRYGASRAPSYGYAADGPGWRVPAHDTVAVTVLLGEGDATTAEALAVVDRSSGTPVLR
ncbi:MAG: hypothetical protein CME34_18095 [Gordonia sp.]|nr:hypothetical protein [Gordonia sp. (in: high G+C Gram-positive bacteria)]MAU83740.1 hypothetical protein [Gordonia sp. (in: high G+C Gram-positive bacteria)]